MSLTMTHSREAMQIHGYIRLKYTPCCFTTLSQLWQRRSVKLSSKYCYCRGQPKCEWKSLLYSLQVMMEIAILKLVYVSYCQRRRKPQTKCSRWNRADILKVTKVKKWQLRQTWPYLTSHCLYTTVEVHTIRYNYNTHQPRWNGERDRQLSERDNEPYLLS